MQVLLEKFLNYVHVLFQANRFTVEKNQKEVAGDFRADVRTLVLRFIVDFRDEFDRARANNRRQDCLMSVLSYDFVRVLDELQ